METVDQLLFNPLGTETLISTIVLSCPKSYTMSLSGGDEEDAHQHSISFSMQADPKVCFTKINMNHL